MSVCVVVQCMCFFLDDHVSETDNTEDGGYEI